MKTVLNIKIDPKLKKQAQKVAASIGLPLGTVTNILLRKFVDEKSIHVAESYVPNARLRRSIREDEKDYRNGKFEGPFNNAKDLVKSLNR